MAINWMNISVGLVLMTPKVYSSTYFKNLVLVLESSLISLQRVVVIIIIHFPFSFSFSLSGT